MTRSVAAVLVLLMVVGLSLSAGSLVSSINRQLGWAGSAVEQAGSGSGTLSSAGPVTGNARTEDDARPGSTTRSDAWGVSRRRVATTESSAAGTLLPPVKEKRQRVHHPDVVHGLKPDPFTNGNFRPSTPYTPEEDIAVYNDGVASAFALALLAMGKSGAPATVPLGAGTRRYMKMQREAANLVARRKAAASQFDDSVPLAP